MYYFLFSQEWFQDRVTHKVQFRGDASGVSDDLAQAVSPEQPVCYAETGGRGYVFMANGLMKMLKWDGVAREAELVGVEGPTDPCTITALGNVPPDPPPPPPSPNGLPPGYTYPKLEVGSKKEAEAQNGSDIIKWGSFGWAWMTGGDPNGGRWKRVGQYWYQDKNAVVTTPPDGAEEEGQITGRYTAYVRYIDKDGNASGLSPISNEITANKAKAIQYDDVPVPTDPKVVLKQIIRNTSGQAQVYYVDVETDDLTGTTFVSGRSDEVLFTQEAVALYDAVGNNLGNAANTPPDHKPYIASYGTRMFAAGDVVYSRGHAVTTFGSRTVTGVGTDWPEVLAGRLFYPLPNGKGYEILSVDSPTQLTLTADYDGESDPFCVYRVVTYPAVRRLVYFTEPGLPDAWAPFNAIELEENGDLVTGLAAVDSFLLVLQERHIYRLSFRADPLNDGGLFLAGLRGCVSNRCWVEIDGTLYLMDEQGCYTYSGASGARSISQPIQDVFQLEKPATGYRINWSARRFFHCVASKYEGTIRWFVALTGSKYPRHALCYSYVTEQWWVEEYPFPVGDTDYLEAPIERPFYGASGRRFLTSGTHTLDGPVPGSGTLRGTVTAAGRTWVEDAAANFPAGLAGYPVAIAEGPGKGQVRTVTSSTATRLNLDRPFLVSPTTESTYQVGAVPWEWRSAWFRWLNDRAREEQRRFVLLFNPCAADSKMDLEVFRDHSEVAEASGIDWPPSAADADGVTTQEGRAPHVIDLTRSDGFVQVRLPDGQDRYAWKPNLFSLRFKGFAGESRVRVYELILEGATGNVP